MEVGPRRPEDGAGGNETVAEELRRRFGDTLPELSLPEAGPEADSDRPEGTEAEEAPAATLEDSTAPRPVFEADAVVGRLPTAGGRYQIRGEFARGGMGAILDVHDTDLRRDLAMKVLLSRPGASSAAATGRVQLARFLREAQVNAQLDHPGVVPVHELGLGDDGQLYFTMKRVRGEDLLAVLGKVFREEEGWTRTRALHVVLRVCEALGFAHAKGVVHRDVKPANVMVGRFGEVYLMDWGLARVVGVEEPGGAVAEDPSASDASTGDPISSGGAFHQTLEGQALGTPAYMPPEQALGRHHEVGPRSDVYSVGALLYHLLSGEMPYVGELADPSAHSVLQAVQARAPEPLGRRATGMPPELVAICERAMAREIEHRYPTIAELAEDLRAFLESRVVQAYRTGAWVEARLWVSRNRALAASLAAGVLFLVAGLFVSGSQKRKADESARWAEEHRQAAVHSMSLAELRRGEAETATLLAERRRREAEQSATEARRQGRIAEEVNSFLNNDLLAAVAPEHEGIDVTVREVLELASDRLEGRFADEPQVEAELRGTIGLSFLHLGELDRALPLLSRARDLFDAELGPDHQRSLRMTRDVTRVLCDLGRHDEARAAYEDVIARSAAVLGDEHEDTVGARCDLAVILIQQGDYPGARALLEEVLEAEERVRGPGSPTAVIAASNLATVLGGLGEFDRAMELQRRVRAHRQRTLGPEHPDTLLSAAVLADLLRGLRRLDESEQLLIESLPSFRKVFGPRHPRTAHILSLLGAVYVVSGRWSQAREVMEESLSIVEPTLGELHQETLSLRATLVHIADQLGEPGGTERYAALYERMCEAVGRRHPRSLSLMGNLAVRLQLEGETEEARATFLEARELMREVMGPGHPMTLQTLENLGNTFIEAEEFEEAREAFAEVLERREEAEGVEDPARACALHGLGICCFETADPEAAVVYLQDARDCLRRGPPEEAGRLPEVLEVLFDALLELDRHVEAEPLALELQRHHAAQAGEGSPGEREARARLRRLYQAWGRPEEAARWSDESP